MNVTHEFVSGIRELIAGARTTVARGVDLVQVHTNFEIGRRIVEEEQRGEDRATYGKQITQALAQRLTSEFGRGFSDTNLKLMRLFYLQNQDRIGQSMIGQFNTISKSQTVSGQLPIFQSATGESGPSQIGQSVTDQLAIPQTASGELGSPPARPLPPELDPLRLPPRCQEPERA